MTCKFAAVALGLASVVLVRPALAADGDAPASPEVTATLQPYLDQYKMAGIIGLIADRTGKVHYKNLLGYADVEAKKPISEGDVIPALVKIMGSDRSVNADTRSAATLALAKVTEDPAHIALLLAPIDGKTASAVLDVLQEMFAP